MAGYYREFIKGYADLTAPLQHLKKQNVDFEWGEEQQKAFEDVKTALTNPPVLAMPTQDGAYVLDTDASDVAIAGILHQWQYSEEVKKNVLKVIGYASRSLTDAQTRYGAAKLEMFAALKMIEKFAPHLANRTFLLRVDCSALSWLQTYGTQQNSLAARWIARLEGYHFRVEQRSRTKHRNADGLSKRTNEVKVKRQTTDKEDTSIKEKKKARLPFLDPRDWSKIPQLTSADITEEEHLDDSRQIQVAPEQEPPKPDPHTTPATTEPQPTQAGETVLYPTKGTLYTPPPDVAPVQGNEHDPGRILSWIVTRES